MNEVLNGMRLNRTIKITAKNNRFVVDVFTTNSLFRYRGESYGADFLTQVQVQGQSLKDIIENGTWNNLTGDPQKAFFTECAGQIKEFLRDMRQRENQARKQDNLPKLPIFESYPMNPLKAVFVEVPRMLWTIYMAQENASPKRDIPIFMGKVVLNGVLAAGIGWVVFLLGVSWVTVPLAILVVFVASALIWVGLRSDKGGRYSEARKFFKLILFESAFVAAIFILLAVIFFTPQMGIVGVIAGLIPFVLMLVLNFWTMLYLNYSSLIAETRSKTHMDNVSTWKAVQRWFTKLCAEPRVNNSDFGYIFTKFFLRLIKNMRNSDVIIGSNGKAVKISGDQPGRGPLISEKEYNDLLTAFNNNTALPMPESSEARRIIIAFINKWVILSFDKPQFAEVIEGLKNNSDDYRLNVYISGYGELVWNYFDDLDTKDSKGELSSFPETKQVVTRFHMLMKKH
jgi:hypothetical protein